MAFVNVSWADQQSTSQAASTVTMGNLGSQFNFPEGKAQSILQQTPNLLNPMPLFVYTEDYRNIMELLTFIYEHPVLYRWELEKWAKGTSASEVTIASINNVSRGNPSDRIVFTLDINRIRLIVDSSGKTIAKADHKGTGTGNTTSAKIISPQNLCRFALEALDYGINVFEFKAQIIASRVEGSAGGFAIGGGLANVNNGGTAVGIPAVLGYSRGRTGKVGLEGIQAELYNKKIIVFEDDAADTQKHIEELWKKEKEAAKEREELNKLQKDTQKAKLRAEKKIAELNEKQADLELDALKSAPPPAPKPEAAPPKPAPELKTEAAAPVAPPAPKVEVPPCTECLKEKKKLEEELAAKKAANENLEEMAREANTKVREIKKEIEDITEVCPVAIEFAFNEWVIPKSELQKLPQMAKWAAERKATVQKYNLIYYFVGTADERVIKRLDSPAEDYINPRWSILRGRATLLDIKPEMRKLGFTSEELEKGTTAFAGMSRFFPKVKGAKNEVDHQENRKVYLVISTPIPGTK